MKGGIMDMIDVSNAGEIERLRADEEEVVICTGSFFGFGKVTIDVTIESESARPEKVTRSSTGFVFLFKFYPGA